MDSREFDKPVKDGFLNNKKDHLLRATFSGRETKVSVVSFSNFYFKIDI
jgi:hypothetical protein